MNQKELASRITKENGTAISPQYLNDIEHDRRSPSSQHLISEFAKHLQLTEEYLFFLAGQLPKRYLDDPYDAKQVERAFEAFRRVLEREPSSARKPSPKSGTH